MHGGSVKASYIPLEKIHWKDGLGGSFPTRIDDDWGDSGDLERAQATNSLVSSKSYLDCKYYSQKII